jgi:hypothetical protein
VAVNFNVIDPSPLLTSDASLGLAALNPVSFPISYSTLVSSMGASWVEATIPAQQELQITSITTGTLLKNGTAQSAPFLIGPTDTLAWVPPVVLPDPTPFGSTDHVNAFTVNAYDGFNAVNFPAFTTSVATHTVFINVLNVNPPTVVNTAITLGPKARYVPSTITYADIQSASGAALGVGNTGDTLAFRVESIQSGSLQITHSGVTTSVTAAQVAAGMVFILPGDTVIWTSAPRATGTAAAFTVSAFDVEKNLDGFSNVAVSVNLVNFAPTLTAVTTLAVADQQTPFNISYFTLLGASNASDPNNDPIQFQIASVQSNGTLTITHNNSTSTVVPGTTVFTTGDTLTWTPGNGVLGNAVNAFTVTAFDGLLSSSPPVQVAIKVRAFGSAFDLSGPWTVDDGSGNSVGLGRVTQTGTNLTVVNANGIGSAAHYVSFNQIVASNFDNQTNVTGTIDTTTADDGRILWADGTVWLRISLGGQYSVTGPGIMGPTLASITQNGVLLTLVNGGTTNSATITGTSQLTVSLGGGITGQATFGDGRISFTNNGQVWTKLDLPPDYTNPGGAGTHILQNGTSLTFVDKFGSTSPGFWTSPTQLFATAWNQTVTTAPGKLLWQDGTVWSENLVLMGTKGGKGTTTITANPSQISVTDYLTGTGKTVHIVQTGTTNLIFIDSTGHMALGTFVNSTQAFSNDYPGDIATFSPNKIVWSDGTVWNQTSATSAITVTHYTNQNGIPVHIVQNGTSQIAFVDGLGRTSLGTMLSPTTAVADLYPGDIATFTGNTVHWMDGTVWTQTTVVPLLITFIDTNGAVSHVQIQSRTSLIGLDGPMKGMTATRLNGKFFWSNNTVWDNFDFNAVNALFQMAVGYP